VSPELGRRFRVGNAKGKTNVAILSHGLWLSRFGARRDTVGAIVTIDQKRYEVVGVMPAMFDYPREAQLWVPFAYDEEFTTTNRGAWYLTAVGRLRPGVSAKASAELATIASRLERPETELAWRWQPNRCRR
jgi:hypothetical protein